MERKIKLIVLCTISICTVLFLDYKIHTDISYHAGKDGGYFKRFESIIILTILFFSIMAKRKKLLFMIFGFLNAIIITFSVLLIFRYFPASFNEANILHFSILGLSFVSFFGNEKLLEKFNSRKPCLFKAHCIS